MVQFFISIAQILNFIKTYCKHSVRWANLLAIKTSIILTQIVTAGVFLGNVDIANARNISMSCAAPSTSRSDNLAKNASVRTDVLTITNIPNNTTLFLSSRNTADATRPWRTGVRFERLGASTANWSGNYDTGIMNRGVTRSATRVVTFSDPSPTAVRTMVIRMTVRGRNDQSPWRQRWTVRCAPNFSPTGDAGTNQTVDSGDNVNLSGSGSEPNDAAPVTFSWAGPADITLTGANTATPSFVAPILVSDETSRVMPFTLTITDNDGESVTRTVDVTVTPPANLPPIADAGPDQNAGSGDTVNLSATGSEPNDPDPVTFAWTGPPGVIIAGANTATPSFTAPNLPSDAIPQVLTFTVTATDDDGETITDTADVTVTPPANLPPIADAGPDQNAGSGDTVNLSATGSEPNDPDPVTFAWTGPPGVIITGANTATPSFTAPNLPSNDPPRVLTFTLTVTDDDGETITRTVNITVSPPVPEISVTGNGVTIVNGDSTPSTTDNTDFGTLNLTGFTETRTFTILSEGANSLLLGPGPITISGPGAGSFSITQPAITVIPSGSSTTFDVTYDPSTVGNDVATISIPSDDLDENPYTFNVSGLGQSDGRISIIQRTSGPDTTTGFTSPTPDLNFTLTTVDGTAQQDILNLPAGTYVINAEDLSASGYGIASISCNDSNSVGDPTTGAVTINLEANEQLSCTFAYVETSQKTSQLIADYLGARNALLLAHQPELERRLIRLNGRNSRGSAGNISAFGLSANTPLPFNAAISEDTITFDASIRSLVGAGQGSDELASAYANNSKWDFWVQGRIARFEGDNEDSGNFGVIYGGVDYLLNPDTLIGIIGQYDWLDQKTSGLAGAPGSSIEGSGWMVGPYGIFRLDENYYFDVRAMWGRSENTISPFNTYEDDFDTERWTIYAALVGEFEVNDWRVRPSIKFQYIEENQENYIDSLGVTIPEQTVAQGDVRIGPRFSYDYLMDDGVIASPWFHIEGVYSFTEEGRFTNGTFADEVDGLSATVKLGFDLTDSNGVSLSVLGQMDGLGTDATSYGGRLQLNIPLN